ncbi:MAG: LexA family protein, partial [Nitrospiraceae bacterium]
MDSVTIGYMHPDELKRARRMLGFTQEQLAQRLKTTRMTITRYESGTRRIPGPVEVVLKQLAAPSSRIAMAGIVAAGNPIEPIPQSELVDVPPSMLQGGQSFALTVKGDSMRDDGILPGDIVVVRKQATARNGQTVVALVNNEATVKKYYRKERHIELYPANS